MGKKASEMTNEEIERELGSASQPKLKPVAKLSTKELEAELASLESAPKADKASTALEALGKGLTLGYLPNMQAMAEPITDRIFNAATGANIEAAPLSQVSGATDEYIKSRDENVKRQATQAAANPGTALAGNVAGSLISGIASGGALPPAATVAGRIAQGAGAGAAISGLQNPGQEAGEISPLQLRERTQNAVTGGLLGGATAGVAEAGKAALNPIKDFIRGRAEKSAFKALGPYAREAMVNYDKGTINSTGRTVLDEGVVGGLPKSYEKLAIQADKALKSVGEKIEKIVNNLDEFGTSKNIGVDRGVVGNRLRERLIDKSGVPGVGRENTLFNDLIEEFEQTGNGPLGIKQAQELKTSIGNKINWSRIPGSDIPEKEMFYRTLYDELNKKTNQVAEDLATAASNEVRDEFLKAKKTYGALKEAGKIANKRESKEFANRLLSPTDYLTGGVGAAAGFASGDSVESRFKNAAIGAGAGLANKLGRQYGNQVFATGLNNLGNSLTAIPGSITKNPIAAQSVIQNLINQSPLQRRLQKVRGE